MYTLTLIEYILVKRKIKNNKTSAVVKLFHGELTLTGHL